MYAKSTNVADYIKIVTFVFRPKGLYRRKYLRNSPWHKWS